MKIFKKDGPPQPTKLEKRVSGIGTTELVMWAENSLAVIGKGVYHHQRDGIEGLLDAEIGAEALLAIVRELKKRAI
jgi:hypothetical protein